MQQNLRKQNLTPRKFGSPVMILKHLDEKIAKLSQMRQLLADPIVLATVMHLALEIEHTALNKRNAAYERMVFHEQSCPVCNRKHKRKPHRTE